MQHGGLLSGLSDPELMARLAERRRIAERISERMGVSLQDAREALDAFESDLSLKGHQLH
ncbi:hypothetical protein [Bradyrhizobium icense]|uniref:hypothetical protein n=1 Tax=Bradyrhizobium icense TaxID=1274631 RepID=UPI0012E9BAB2|nr:hypothetical protein [Bradyrhizobium icense]